jgi:ABC-type transporter Mla subunit MlaD
MSIAVDFDGVFAELKRLLRELQEFPSPAEVAVVEGEASSTTREFHQAVANAAREMGDATERAIEKLQNTHDTIRAAVLQLAEQDAALADETKLIVSLLDSAVEQTESMTPVGGGLSDGVKADAADSSTEPEDADF